MEQRRQKQARGQDELLLRYTVRLNMTINAHTVHVVKVTTALVSAMRPGTLDLIMAAVID